MGWEKGGGGKNWQWARRRGGVLAMGWEKGVGELAMGWEKGVGGKNWQSAAISATEMQELRNGLLHGCLSQ